MQSLTASKRGTPNGTPSRLGVSKICVPAHQGAHESDVVSPISQRLRQLTQLLPAYRWQTPVVTLPDRLRRCSARAGDLVAQGTAQCLDAVLSRMPGLWETRDMPNRSSKRPRDLNSLAKFIEDMATGQVEMAKTDDGKDPAAVALGRKGGLKGGKARADALSKERRVQIAKEAAARRWENKRAKPDANAREAVPARRKRRTKIATPEG
jgi:hypothetical protein